MASSGKLIFSLPNNKILAFTKLEVFAEGKFNVAKMMISVCDRVENIVGKRDNSAIYPFSTMF